MVRVATRLQVVNPVVAVSRQHLSPNGVLPDSSFMRVLVNTSCVDRRP